MYHFGLSLCDGHVMGRQFFENSPDVLKLSALRTVTSRSLTWAAYVMNSAEGYRRMYQLPDRAHRTLLKQTAIPVAGRPNIIESCYYAPNQPLLVSATLLFLQLFAVGELRPLHPLLAEPSGVPGRAAAETNRGWY